MEKSVVVVGGGLAGLTASVFLARAGFAVTIYEKSAHIGGRGITNKFGEVLFNLGPHALYPGARAVLQELGIAFSGGKPIDYYATYKGKLSYLPDSPAHLLKTKLFGVGAKIELAQVFGKLAKVKPQEVQNVSVKDWLAQNIRNEAIRDLVGAILRLGTYANVPEKLSAGYAIGVTQAVLRDGVIYPDGGWQTLVDGLEQAARTAKVNIVTSAAVAAVDNDGVTLANGTKVKATAIIICAAPEIANKLIENGNHPQLSQFAHNAIEVRAACLDIALQRLPLPERKVVLALDEPLYFSIHSTVAKLAPEGVAVIHVAKYLHPDEKHDPHTVEKELEAFMERCQPGWRDLVIHRRYLPNLLVTNALATAKDNGVTARPSGKVAGYGNVYLAGDWVGTQGNLAEAAFISAKNAAHQIMKSVELRSTN
jgi:phytoene dehydrogenase-like protein